MIFTFLFNLIAYMVAGILLVFPVVTELPTWMQTPLDMFVPFIAAIYSIDIFAALFTVLLLGFGLLAALQAIVFANWLYNKIRGSG